MSKQEDSGGYSPEGYSSAIKVSTTTTITSQDNNTDVIKTVNEDNKNKEHCYTSDDTKKSTSRDHNEDDFITNALEAKHFADVCNSIAQYSLSCMGEISRIEKHLRSLSDDDKQLLSEPITPRVEKIKNAVLKNQKFLSLLLADQKNDSEYDESDFYAYHQAQHAFDDNNEVYLPGTKMLNKQCCTDDLTHKIDNETQALTAKSPPYVMPRDSSKVRSTLRQFVRDWSEEGNSERAAAYNPLLEDLVNYLPLEPFKQKNNRVPKVLCPGSGLGRLPFEVVLRGYGCQGNEFSYYMLLGSNFVLNSELVPKSYEIYPYCLSTSNRFGAEDHLLRIEIPDICPGSVLKEGQDFSMCAGEFVEVYWNQEKQWDAVLTSFFLDTAKNVILYIRTISRILKIGGLWSNLGPFLFHYAESPQEVSIELSWEELRSIIQKYFVIVKEDIEDAYYTSNKTSMMQVIYHCVHFVAIRNDTPLTGISTPVY